MNRMFNRLTLTKRNVVVAVLVFVCLLYLFYKITPHKPASPPRTVIAKAMTLTAKAEEYKYLVEMKTSINGKEGVYTNVEGWRDNRGNLHIKGKITDAEIEFYQIGSTTYTKDRVSGEWITIKDNQLNQAQIFAAELNPLANFGYKSLTEIKYQGIVDERDQRVWKYTVKPIVNNSFLEILWEDFEYEFWIGRGNGMLTKAALSAVSKTNRDDKLYITVLFDYERDVEIKPPI